MDKEELEEKLKRAAVIKFTEHALFQMNLRHIPKTMIVEFLKDKRPFDFIIEKDPRGKKYTVGYHISNSRDLYITLKFKNEGIYIITAIISSKKVIDNIRKRMGKWTKRRL
ncbi:MAG: DUF4258 domain-containing protein [Nanoarchaeota archaeon]|nr:DUF4258 domain-containing protein [Nanoarchaeota archaeon]MBU4300366.1 DUF4258 domain-containing protein [Nanoarchaeota archaeon]MBU4452155.1 DUF4258 domain-containing protein [Nanoarchaeota archaeon]MCG2724288.1 DUF4258 domain-containing protein [archaeon]